jgi:hypothetical protein
VPALPTLAEIKSFESSGTRIKIITALRDYLNVRPLEATDRAWLDQVAEDAAETKHAVADMVNVMLEELIHHRYELPAFSTLDQMAFRAREKSNNWYFTAISSQMSPKILLTNRIFKS